MQTHNYVKFEHVDGTVLRIGLTAHPPWVKLAGTPCFVSRVMAGEVEGGWDGLVKKFPILAGIDKRDRDSLDEYHNLCKQLGLDPDFLDPDPVYFDKI